MATLSNIPYVNNSFTNTSNVSIPSYTNNLISNLTSITSSNTTIPNNNSISITNPTLLTLYKNTSKNSNVSPYLASVNNTSPTAIPSNQNTNTSMGPTNAGNLLNIDQAEIGLVPHMTGTIKGAGLTQSVSETDIIKLGLVKIEMIPMQIHFVGTSFMLYKLEPAKKSDSPPPRLIIYTYPNEISVEESFGNQLQSSFFESLVNPLEKLGQLAKLNVPIAKDLGNLIYTGLTDTMGGIADLTGHLSDVLSKGVMSAQGTLGEAVSTYLQGSRIMWPKIWADSNMVVNYTIPIYLFCNNMLNDDVYKKSIVDPLQHLLQYTLPRSTGGGTYNWPWMVYAVAPGLFVLPEGIVSNITIDKYDIGFNNRPATVKATMTLTALREVMPQDGVSKGVNNIPTVALNLNTYLDNFRLNKNSTDIPIWESSTPTASTSVPLSSSGGGGGGSVRNLNSSQIMNTYKNNINTAINSVNNKNPNLTPQLVACMIDQESSGDPTSIGWNKQHTVPSFGLMQLQLSTAQQYGVQYSSQLQQVQPNLNAGTAYLNSLLNHYTNTKPADPISYAVSAYNQGQTATDLNGITNKTYVDNVMNCYNKSSSSSIPFIAL